VSEEKHYCEEPIWESNWPRAHPCGKTAKHFENGRWFCGIHCEEAKLRRSEKSQARIAASRVQWDKDRAAAAETQRRADMFDQLVEAIEEVVRLARWEVDNLGYAEDRNKVILTKAESALKAAKEGVKP